MRNRRLVLGLVIGTISVAAIMFAWNRSNLRPYRDWLAAYPLQLEKPTAYGLEWQIRPADEDTFKTERIVFEDGVAAYEEHSWPENSRLAIIHPYRGKPRQFIFDAAGGVQEKDFNGDGYYLKDRNYKWEIGNPRINGKVRDAPLWTMLTAPLLHMQLVPYNLTWDKFRELPVRRLPDDVKGRMRFQARVPVPSNDRRAQIAINLYLDPTKENRLVRVETVRPFSTFSEPPSFAGEILSWQTLPDGRICPREITQSYVGQEIGASRIVNPSLGTVDSSRFDIQRIAERIKY